MQHKALSLLATIGLALFLALPLPAAFAGSSTASTDAVAVINGHSIRPTPAKTYGPEIIKPDDLKWCVANIDKVNADSRSIKAEKARLQSEGDRVKAEHDALTKIGTALGTQGQALSAKSQEIAQQHALVDKTKKASVDAYNANLKSFSEQNDAYKAKVKEYRVRGSKFKDQSDLYKQHQSAFNTSTDALNKSVAEFSLRCSNKNYYEDDMATAKGK